MALRSHRPFIGGQRADAAPGETHFTLALETLLVGRRESGWTKDGFTYALESYAVIERAMIITWA